MSPLLISAPVIPDVWELPSTGMQWCDCGSDCPLTPEVIDLYLPEVCDKDAPERLTHQQVIDLAALVWQLTDVCRFFTMAIEQAALRVNGSVEEDYPTPVGYALIRDFSNTWNGCPEESCL